MKRLLIGQCNKFDLAKQNRDFRNYFWGIEASQMETTSDLQFLKENMKDRNLKIGIHFPLLNNIWRARDPQYLSKNMKTYEESIDYMNYEFKIASEFKPEYILLHFPKPVIIDDNFHLSSWRFYDKTEYYYESEISFDYFKEGCEKFFEFFSECGNRYNFIPILELDALNKYVYSTSLLENLLEKYLDVRLCLDFGRIHLQDCIDDNFKGKEIIKRFGKYTHLVHLWNVKVDTNVSNAHYPALKSLKPSEGWCDVKAYFEILNRENHDYKVLFEHNSKVISDEELEECYRWIDDIINGRQV